MADFPAGGTGAQVFFPKNKVKDKVGQGGIATDLLQKAREAVTAMEQDYSSIVEEQLADIWKIFFETQDGTLDRQQGIQRILNAAFNLKGEAQSYGYPVIGRIGNSLYRYTSANPNTESSMMLKIIKLHLEAIAAIAKHKIRDDSNPVAKEIAKNLELAIKKYSKV